MYLRLSPLQNVTLNMFHYYAQHNSDSFFFFQQLNRIAKVVRYREQIPDSVCLESSDVLRLGA